MDPNVIQTAWQTADEYKDTISDKIEYYRKLAPNVLTKNSTFDIRTIRRCAAAVVTKKCGCKPFHKGKFLPFQLHHIGDKNDHRRESLAWYCPNCHAQTPNFAGREPKTSKRIVAAAHCIMKGGTKKVTDICKRYRVNRTSVTTYIYDSLITQ